MGALVVQRSFISQIATSTHKTDESLDLFLTCMILLTSRVSNRCHFVPRPTDQHSTCQYIAIVHSLLRRVSPSDGQCLKYMYLNTI